jgi:hypothetical protein
MRKILLFIVFILLLGSCQKDNITVTLKTSGTLSVIVTDNNKNPLINQNVRLYTYYSSMSSNLLDNIKTNSNGEVNFGEVTEGTYTVVIDTPKVNGIKYLPIKTVQVLSGSGKTLTINVQEYSGTLNIKVVDNNNNALSGYNVILIASENFNSSDNINTKINKAEFRSTTNTSGLAVFQIPSSRDFYFIAYDNSKTHISSYNYAYVEKDGTISETAEIYIY